MNRQLSPSIGYIHAAARVFLILISICAGLFTAFAIETPSVVYAQTFCPRSPQPILTTSQGIIGSPRLNTTGRRVTFESSQDWVAGSNGDGNIEIFYSDITNLESATINPSATTVQLTDTDGDLFRGMSLSPAISGDGVYVLFASDDDPTDDETVLERENGQYELFIANLQNSNAISMSLVTNMGFPRVGTAMNPVFNTDGSRAVYLANNILHFDINTFSFPNLDGSTEVFLVEGDFANSGTLATTMLSNTSLTEFVGQPDISGDGTHVAYVYDPDLADQGEIGSRIRIVDTSTIPATIINVEEPTTGHQSQPQLNQDGSRIAYTVSQPAAGTSEVWFYDEQESLYRQISTGGYNLSPSISDEGSRVVYVRMDPTNQQHNIYLYNKANNSNTLLSNTTAYNEQPTISGDGTTIAFVGFANSISTFDNSGMGLYMAYCP
ncbi:MAG: hypothetical protein AAF639_01860 [Chloroflexota bacterium]